MVEVWLNGLPNGLRNNRSWVQSPVIKTKLSSRTGKARPKVVRLVNETFFCILRKRASLGQAALDLT
jgi:hypothetical protein